jgi:uncharacterized protein (DUF2147 family)
MPMLTLLPLALMLPAPDALPSVWRNPHDSVHVRLEPCGEQMCGTVVWATDKAIADARKGSTQPLVGTRIFRDFHVVKPNVWRGKVYVPDIAKTFGGTVTIDGDRMIGKGCLIAGRIGCKSQTWSRVAD